MEELHHEYNMGITKIRDCLIVSFPAEVTDEVIREIENAVTAGVYQSDITGAVMNFSMMSMIDSFIFNELVKITKALSLMGVNVVWVGLRANVVCALMDLKIEVDNKFIRTAATLDQALEMLEEQGKPKGAETVHGG